MNLRISLLAILAIFPSLSSGRRLRRRSDEIKKVSYRQVLHNHQNVQYYADFTIGGQDIAGIFDTGSFELLVRSERCEKCVHPTPAYSFEKSSSFLANGTMTRHVFGSGPCETLLGYETVSVGPLKSENQAFWEIVNHQIPVMNAAKFAAIVGIGPNFGFGNKEKTLLMSFGIEEFSICLQRESGSDGYLTWGPGEKELPEREVFKAKVIGKHHWETRMRDVHFDSEESLSILRQTKADQLLKASGKEQISKAKVIAPCADKNGCVAIVDSGTSLIAAPSAALRQLSMQLGEVKEDCSNLNELPNLRFNLDGNIFELPPQAYVMRINGAKLEAMNIFDLLFFKPKIRTMDMCMPAFMQMDLQSPNGPMWILGMPFFRYYHTTFDRTKQEMRFARAGKHCEALPVRNGGQNSLLSTETDSRSSAPLPMDLGAMMSPRLSLQADDAVSILQD